VWSVSPPLNVSVSEAASDAPPRAYQDPMVLLTHSKVEPFFQWPSDPDPRRVQRTEKRYLEMACHDLRLTGDMPIIRTSTQVASLALLGGGFRADATIQGVDPAEQLGGLEGTDLGWRRERLHNALKGYVAEVSGVLATFCTLSLQDPIPSCWGSVQSFIQVCNSPW